MTYAHLFPPLSPRDSVTREAEALVQRYQLMELLKDQHGERRDLRGAPPEPELVMQMRRQLVAGVDAPLVGTRLGWPIRAGVRLEALFASPWLTNAGSIAGVHSVPTDARSFADLFSARTGIAPNSPALRAAMRVTPFDMGKIAEEVRGSTEKPEPAFLFLVSRHFESAAGAASVLRLPRTTGFRGTPIKAFRIMAELERIALVSEDLARFNLKSVKTIRTALAAKSPRAIKRLLTDPWVRRLADYLAIGSDVLGGVENGDKLGEDGGYVPAYHSARHTGAAHGAIEVDTGKALEEDEVTRILFAAAFPPNADNTRESALQNDDPGMFYGLNRHFVGAMIADLLREVEPEAGDCSREAVHERAAALAAEIVAKTDPLRAAAHASRAATLSSIGGGSKHASGVNAQRDADALGELMLPAVGELGATPRANPNLWDNRWVDNQLWDMILNADLKAIAGLNAEERQKAEEAVERMKSLFSKTFEGAAKRGSVDEVLALRAVCDIAQAMGPISMNRLFARSITDWLKSAETDSKSHGRRFTPGAKRLLNAKQHRGGLPNANVAKKMRKAIRLATRKRNALNILKP
jgi:hypothetical protein